MHVISRYTAADAAGMIEPCGRVITLSVAFVAGVLLLNMVPVIDVTGMLNLLTAPIAAFSVGQGSAYGHSWLYRSPLTATHWVLLLSAAGRLLALVAWYSGQGWPTMLPGVACGGAGVAVAWRIMAGRSAQCESRVGGATLLSVVVVVATTLLAQHTARAGHSGVCLVFAVLLGLPLLGALIVRIRQPESAAQMSPRGK